MKSDEFAIDGQIDTYLRNEMIANAVKNTSYYKMEGTQSGTGSPRRKYKEPESGQLPSRAMSPQSFSFV